MIVAQRERQNLARSPYDHFRGRPSGLGRILQQLLFQDLLELAALPGIFHGQSLKPLHQEFERLLPEVEHPFA